MLFCFISFTSSEGLGKLVNCVIFKEIFQCCFYGDSQTLNLLVSGCNFYNLLLIRGFKRCEASFVSRSEVLRPCQMFWASDLFNGWVFFLLYNHRWNWNCVWQFEICSSWGLSSQSKQFGSFWKLFCVILSLTLVKYFIDRSVNILQNTTLWATKSFFFNFLSTVNNQNRRNILISKNVLDKLLLK